MLSLGYVGPFKFEFYFPRLWPNNPSNCETDLGKVLSVRTFILGLQTKFCWACETLASRLALSSLHC